MDSIYTSYSNSTVWFGSADQISVSLGHLRLSCHLTSCPSYVLVGITNCILFWRCSDSVIYPSQFGPCQNLLDPSTYKGKPKSYIMWPSGLCKFINWLFSWLYNQKLEVWFMKYQKYGFLGRVTRKKLFLFKNNMATQLGLQNCNNSKT